MGILIARRGSISSQHTETASPVTLAVPLNFLVSTESNDATFSFTESAGATTYEIEIEFIEE